MIETYSRPIHRLGGTADGYMIERQTRMSNLSVRPGTSDVTVAFVDGAGGQVLWRVEADNAAGSHTESFVPGMLFKNGIYVEVIPDAPDNDNWSVSIAVIEPTSSGT